MSSTKAKTLDWEVDGYGETRGYGPFVRLRPTKRQIHEALGYGVLTVKDDEQRGFDPVTGREILNDRKMEDWRERELDGRLFVGQLNFALHVEAGATCEVNNGRAHIIGTMLMADGRQRAYTIQAAMEHVDQYGHDNYDPDEPVEVTLWLDADSDMRKEIYAQLNGARGGDHASKSSATWMAPEGPLQKAAKHLVQTSRNLGQDNVNVKVDAVRKNDHRLAGFHTFVKALENAWGKRRLPTPEEAEELKAFLVRFYDRLAQARPEMGVVDLGTRQKSREEMITGNPLFLYGAMQVAVDLFLEEGSEADLSRLDALSGEEGDEFFSMDNHEWVARGILRPQYDPQSGEIRAWRITNNLQTRRAMAQAMHDRFYEETGEAA